MGWADAIVLDWQPGEVHVLHRTRADFARGQEAMWPYHAAGAAPEDEREMVLETVTATVHAVVLDIVAELVSNLEAEVGAVVVGNMRRIPLEKVLESSRLFHTAEGAVYQRAIGGALDALGVPCSRVKFDEAESHECWEAVSALGKEIGPPWRKDHKFAGVAAWVAAEAATT